MARVSLFDRDAFGGPALLLAEAEDGEQAVEAGFHDAAEAEQQQEDHAGDHADDDSGDGAAAQSVVVVVRRDGEYAATGGGRGQERDRFRR